MRSAFLLIFLLLSAGGFAQDMSRNECAHQAELPDYHSMDIAAAEEYHKRLVKLYNDQGHWLRSDPRATFYENVLVGDTSITHKLIRSMGELKRQGVSQAVVPVFAENDVMIKAKVIAIDNVSDRCLRFKITYRVKVEKVFWTHGEVKESDEVFIVDFNPGKDAGCGTDADNVASYTNVDEALKIGQSYILIADHGRYARIVASDKGTTYFQDSYCPSAYALSPFSEEERMKFVKYYKAVNAVVQRRD